MLIYTCKSSTFSSSVEVPIHTFSQISLLLIISNFMQPDQMDITFLRSEIYQTLIQKLT